MQPGVTPLLEIAAIKGGKDVAYGLAVSGGRVVATVDGAEVGYIPVELAGYVAPFMAQYGGLLGERHAVPKPMVPKPAIVRQAKKRYRRTKVELEAAGYTPRKRNQQTVQASA